MYYHGKLYDFLQQAQFFILLPMRINAVLYCKTTAVLLISPIAEIPTLFLGGLRLGKVTLVEVRVSYFV